MASLIHNPCTRLIPCCGCHVDFWLIDGYAAENITKRENEIFESHRARQPQTKAIDGIPSLRRRLTEQLRLSHIVIFSANATITSISPNPPSKPYAIVLTFQRMDISPRKPPSLLAGKSRPHTIGADQIRSTAILAQQYLAETNNVGWVALRKVHHLCPRSEEAWF